MAVRVTGLDRDRLANLGLGQRQRAAGSAADRVGSCVPLIHDRTQTVRIGQRAGCRQRLPLCCRAADRQNPRWCVIDVHHRTGCCASLALGGTVAVGVVGLDRDELAHLRLRQCQRAAGGTADRIGSGKPLICDRAQAIRIGQCVDYRQRLPLGCRTADRQRTRHRVVDVGHQGGSRAHDRLGRS